MKLSTTSLVGVLLLVIGIVLAAAPVSFGSPGKGTADIKVYSIDSLMTAVYKVYGNEKLGYWVAKTIVRNTGQGPLYDISIKYKIEGLTDWSEPKEYKLVPPGGAIVDLYYPIIAKNPNLQSTMPSTLYIKITYKTTPKAEPSTQTIKRPISLLALHDFVFSSIPPEESTGSFQDTHSNFPLIAAWVTPKDPVVEGFADYANKLAGGAAASASDQDAINFLGAVWEYSLMNGISYQTEPSAFWTGKTAQYIKFPRDVIKDRSGTCIDTSIFYAAIAMSQGLNAYIMLIPGHAFPIIELPSGQVLPIESTMMNGKASFEEAVQMGMQELQEAFSKPHLLVDVSELQAKGIVPPELPTLPPNVLAQWGYQIPGANMGAGNVGGGAGNQGGAVPGGQGGGQGGGQTPGGGGAGTVTYSNPIGGLPWSIQIPADWQPQTYDTDPYEVDIYSPNADRMILISWSQDYSIEDLYYTLASWFNQTFGGYSIAGQNQNGKLGSLQAVTIAFNLGDGSFAVARFTSVNGYSLVVAYLLDSSIVSQDTITSMENIVSTFTVR